MLVTVLSVAVVMLTGRLICGHPMEGKVRNPRCNLEDCSSFCEAGFYKDSEKCVPCKPGFFTSKANKESSCLRCFQSCKHGLNMEVVKNCTNTSDVVCRCLRGYVCTSSDEYTGHCKSCVPITTQGPSPTTSSTKRIDNVTGDIKKGDLYGWILFGLFILSIIVVSLFFWLFRKKEKECLKRLVRQCSLGTIEVDSETPSPIQRDVQPHVHDMLSHDSTPSNQNTDSFHQPISSEQAVPPAGNLGPLHIYGPQTVFVSLLNQFGWDGREKKAHELQEESLNNSNVSHPQSPPINKSVEERSRENFVFFPSQEQGKECHISKEEML